MTLLWHARSDTLGFYHPQKAVTNLTTTDVRATVLRPVVVRMLLYVGRITQTEQGTVPWSHQLRHRCVRWPHLRVAGTPTVQHLGKRISQSRKFYPNIFYKGVDACPERRTTLYLFHIWQLYLSQCSPKCFPKFLCIASFLTNKGRVSGVCQRCTAKVFNLWQGPQAEKDFSNSSET